MIHFEKFAVCALLAVASPVFAQEAAPAAPAAPAAAAPLSLRPGLLIISSDGRRVGRVERVLGDRTAPTGVTVIKDSAFVTVPARTLSAGEGGRVVTSLAYREIR